MFYHYLAIVGIAVALLYIAYYLIYTALDWYYPRQFTGDESLVKRIKMYHTADKADDIRKVAEITLNNALPADEDTLDASLGKAYCAIGFAANSGLTAITIKYDNPDNAESAASVLSRQGYYTSADKNDLYIDWTDEVKKIVKLD